MINPKGDYEKEGEKMKAWLKYGLIVLLILIVVVVFWFFIKDDVTEDVEIKRCENIEINDGPPRGETRTICYYSLALKRQDTTLCDLAGEFENTCKAEIIMNKSDFESCDMIDKVRVRDICYSYVAEDHFNYNNGDYDMSLCLNIEDLGISDGCYLGVSLVSGNISGCDFIEDPDFKDACYADIIMENSYTKDACYSSFSTLSENISICDFIKSEGFREYCYSLPACVN